MPISGSIFNKAPNSSAGSDDVVGRFRSGFQANNRPVALDHWRITTGDPAVAASIHELLGGDEPSEWETKTGENLQVFTEADSVEVIFDGPGSVKATLVLWSAKGGKVRETDGEFLIEEGKVTDTPDPDRNLPLSERKEMAKDGTGPEPSLQAYFRLADAPDLGKMKFFSGSWTAIESFSEAEEQLAEINGPTRARLSLERVEFTTKAGEERSYTKPNIEILGAV